MTPSTLKFVPGKFMDTTDYITKQFFGQLISLRF